MKSISVDDLAALGSGVPIIDVREEEEYAEASVPGTRNVPLSRFQQSMGGITEWYRNGHPVTYQAGR